MSSAGEGAFFKRLLGTYSGSTLTGASAVSTSVPFYAQPFQNLTFYVQAIGNPGAGTIVLEEGSWEADVQLPYAGTWSPIQSIDASTLVTDAQLAVHVTGSCCQWVRARITVEVTVGTVSLTVVGN